MIESIQFTRGYPTKLLFGRKKILFGNRLNIILGYNGSGKSTLLKAIASDAGLALPLECEKPKVIRDDEAIIYLLERENPFPLGEGMKAKNN